LGKAMTMCCRQRAVLALPLVVTLQARERQLAAERKTPSLFDPEAMMEAQRRNFQALANVGNIVADGMRSCAERQVAMVHESMGHLWSELQSVGKKAPAAPADQLERMRSAFEKVVAQVQELGQHMLEVQSQAMAVLNECAAKNLEVLGTTAPELAALQQKAKSAFEHASRQTSAVIDEMKKHMATLEHETHTAAAAITPKAEAPKPTETKPAAPKPAAPKPAAAKAAPATEVAAKPRTAAAKKPAARAKPKPS
jgi:DNA anti-recombination protein RmuC